MNSLGFNIYPKLLFLLSGSGNKSNRPQAGSQNRAGTPAPENAAQAVMKRSQ